MSSLTKRAVQQKGQGQEVETMRDRQKAPAVQQPFTKTYRLFGTEKRRDAIIALIQQQHRGEPFVAPFVEHLKKIGKDKLDPYSKMEFTLGEYNIRLTFLTSTFEVSEMAYPIADLANEPDHRLRRNRTFLEWLTGPKT
jgi:hypothetical protein